MGELVPRLRFQGFEGNWEKIRLGDISEIITKGTTPKEFSPVGVRFIKIEAFENNFISPEKCLFIDEHTHLKDLKRSILKENDILFAIAGATVGKCNIVSKDILPANTNQALAIIRLKNLNDVPAVYQILRSEKMRAYIKDNVAVGAQPNLNLEQLNNFSFYSSSREEQGKISQFQSLIDEWLLFLQKKKALLEQYKKGMMQKIFSREVRFKDENGKAFGEWEMKQLKDVLFEHKKRNSENIITEVFSVAKHKGVVNQIEHLGRSFSAEDVSNYKICEPFDVVYTKSPTADFPYGIIKQNLTDRTGILSPLYGVFRPSNKSLGYLLHSYFLSEVNTYNYLNPIVEKGAKNTMNINNDTFLNGAAIALPISEKEQTKIANFLSAIDDKIEAVRKQIEKMEVWKKGLLNEMFV